MPRRAISFDSYWKPVCTGFISPCWIWHGGLVNGGYGKYWTGKTELAHRFSFEKNREKISVGFELDHLCKIKACVNPDHLRLVTSMENARHRRNNKLNIDIANEIRERCANGCSQKHLAQVYRVSRDLVSRIVNNKKWRKFSA